MKKSAIMFSFTSHSKPCHILSNTLMASSLFMLLGFTERSLPILMVSSAMSGISSCFISSYSRLSGMPRSLFSLATALTAA